MDSDNRGRIPAHPPVPDRVTKTSPRRVMLMSPPMIVVGGLLAFLTVVFSVVVLPTTTYQPPASDNWLPLSTPAAHGRAVYLANGCVYCHSGFSRPQDVYTGLYYTYPRASEPGDFRGVDQSPNAMGSARTGPDLSQEGGFHPDEWHVAHYQNPRNTTPISIMPSFKFLSRDELDNLIAFDQSQGGKEAVLRHSAVTLGNTLMQMNMGMTPDAPPKALDDLVTRLKTSGEYREGGKGDDKSPSGLPWSAVWMVNSFERGYWLTPDPLELTQQNLIRGKAIFLERCVGCHGDQGDGKGVAAQWFKIKPFDFTDASVSQAPATSSGMMYYRILTAGRGTAMENFGTRLSVQDIWRVVMFLRTIHAGGLKQNLPTVAMFEPWKPPQPLLDYIAQHPLQAVEDLRDADPFASAARWIAPGMAPGDVILVGGKLPMTLARLAELLRAMYFERVETAHRDAQSRGEDVPSIERLRDVSKVQFHAP